MRLPYWSGCCSESVTVTRASAAVPDFGLFALFPLALAFAFTVAALAFAFAAGAADELEGSR